MSLSHEAGHDAAKVQAVEVALRRFQHLCGHGSRCLWMAPVPAMAVSSLWTQTFTSSLGDLLTASREGWCVCLHVCSREIFFSYQISMFKISHRLFPLNGGQSQSLQAQRPLWISLGTPDQLSISLKIMLLLAPKNRKSIEEVLCAVNILKMLVLKLCAMSKDIK